MNPALLGALISQIGIPELAAWLQSRQTSGQTVDDAAVIAKLGMDADEGIAIGEKWLAAHPKPAA